MKKNWIKWYFSGGEHVQDHWSYMTFPSRSIFRDFFVFFSFRFRKTRLVPARFTAVTLSSIILFKSWFLTSNFKHPTYQLTKKNKVAKWIIKLFFLELQRQIVEIAEKRTCNSQMDMIFFCAQQERHLANVQDQTRLHTNWVKVCTHCAFHFINNFVCGKLSNYFHILTTTRWSTNDVSRHFILIWKEKKSNLELLQLV